MKSTFHREDRQQLEIRRANPEDAQAIAEVLQRSFMEFKGLYTAGGFTATTPTSEQIVQRMQHGPVWIAIREGVVMGTVAAMVQNQSVYLRGMAVVPAERRSGAGKRLLQQVEDWARGESYTRLLLSTTPFLDSAIRLYERFGFRPTNEEPYDLFGTRLFTMEKLVDICERVTGAKSP
jgi:GNAT superfamily N-acetyltransferase